MGGPNGPMGHLIAIRGTVVPDSAFVRPMRTPHGHATFMNAFEKLITSKGWSHITLLNKQSNTVHGITAAVLAPKKHFWSATDDAYDG